MEDGKWLSENADRSVRNLYKLHSVLVHSGGVHGGHYYAYIQPDRKRWLKFDDERVRRPALYLVAASQDHSAMHCSVLLPATLASNSTSQHHIVHSAFAKA